MKRLICFILTVCMLCAVYPITANAASGGVKENPIATLPYGDIDISGKNKKIDASNYCDALLLNDDTAGYFWGQNIMTTNASLYFRASDNGLYFAADITENNAAGNSYVPATGVDNIDNKGSSRPYGYNGDVLTLMLDPAGYFERSRYSATAWYNVAAFADGSIHMYRSQVNEKDITDEVTLSGGIKKDGDGWYFQSFIPWEIIFADAKALDGSFNMTAADLNNIVTRACCMYMDRYTSNGKTGTWGRFITVCEYTYDGYFGTATSGTNIKAYGLRLKIDKSNNHRYGAWTTVTTATCETAGTEMRICLDCFKTDIRNIDALGHDWSEWEVITEANAEQSGLKRRICARCNLVDERVVKFYDNDPQVIVYFNATQPTTSFEFTNIDVVNYHPAQITQMAGATTNPIRTSYFSNLDYIRRMARRQNPNIKFCVAIANENLMYFESWFSSDAYRDRLAGYMAELVTKYSLDGVDIDYEFPTKTDLRAPFVDFAAKLRTKLDEIAYNEGREITLSLAVPAGDWAFSLFDIVGLSKYVDYFNIMSYDLYCGSNFKLTHHQAPPYDNAVYPGGSAASNIQLYLDNGIPKDQIVIGSALYSRRWTGVQSDTDGLYAPGTLDESNIHYSDLLSSYVNKNGFIRYWDDSAKAPYLYNKTAGIFLSYDDEESVAAKCDLILENGVRGLMVFDYCTCDGIGFFDKVGEFMQSPGNNHIWSTWEVVKDPTCTENGQKKRVCTCGDIEYDDIPALGHDLITEWSKLPTLTEDGAYNTLCRRCGEESESYPTSITPNTYWGIASSYEALEITDDGNIAVKSTGGSKLNPMAKIISKYTSTLDGFNANISVSEDTDSLCLFWTNSYDWYDEENEWSVGSLGAGGANYRYGVIRDKQAIDEYTYALILCDYLDVGYYIYPGTPNDEIFDTAVTQTVSHGNFWGSGSFNKIGVSAADPIDVEIFNHYDEDDESWALGFVLNDEYYFDSGFIDAFIDEERHDGYHFGVIAYTEGSGNVNAEFTLNSICGDDTTADFMGYPEREHIHEFGEWDVILDSTCATTGLKKHTCLCGICEKATVEKLPHTYGEWNVVVEADASHDGLRERVCEVCGEKDTEVIKYEGGDVEEPAADVTVKNYTLTIKGAADISVVRIAPGVYSTGSEIKKAGCVTLNASVIANSTNANGEVEYELSDGGIYSVWYKKNDGTEVTVSGLDATYMEQEVEVTGAVAKIKNLYGVADFLIGKGDLATYREVKNNLIVMVTNAKFGTKHNFTYGESLPGAGEYTAWVRYTDPKRPATCIHFTVDVNEPNVTSDGQSVLVGNLGGAKAVRIVPGTFAKYGDVKKGAGCITYTANTISKMTDDNGVMSLARTAGDYTVAVQYENGYTAIRNVTVG